MIVDRVYNETHEGSVSFFVGEEIEHSPARGLRTLFVVGLQPWTRINELAIAESCDHIYFGANRSFKVDENIGWWEETIKAMLVRSRNQNGPRYLCTLDFDVKDIEAFLDLGLTEYNNFIPMISVRVPYAGQLGYNATIKIDDRDFDSTNPGVWCHSLHSLMDRSKFTDWRTYTKDQIINDTME